MTQFRPLARAKPVRRVAMTAVLAGLTMQLAACAVLPSAGPKSRTINALAHEQTDPSIPPVQLIEVTAAVSARLKSAEEPQSFAARLGDATPYGSVVGRGDMLDIAVWEAPPAVLFGASLGVRGLGGDVALGQSTGLPEQYVNQEGTVSVPFVGSVQAVGRTPEAIARDIQQRLNGKAHEPQVVVRILRNAAANVTVVGEVAASVRMPLTPKGERLLDALASAGGVRQPVGKTTIQVTRGSTVAAMALSDIVGDPRENIRLASDDIVTALFQPYSFTVLGSAGKNEEVPFERTGLALSQALGRMGGLQDQRANARGVFIFRFEDAALFARDGAQGVAATPDGKVPVIYRVNMKDPMTLFAAQSFPIRDKDVIYVTNAPLADFQKFLQAISQIVYPIVAIQNATNF